jgi:predicted amidophosphoribosyltransferase
MRTTPYGEPSSKEIDALLIPPRCPQCGEDTDTYDTLCDSCETHNHLAHQADILFDDLKHPDP